MGKSGHYRDMLTTAWLLLNLHCVAAVFCWEHQVTKDLLLYEQLWTLTLTPATVTSCSCGKKTQNKIVIVAINESTFAKSRHQLSAQPCVFSLSSVALRHTAAVPHFVLLPVSLFPVYHAVICWGKVRCCEINVRAFSPLCRQCLTDAALSTYMCLSSHLAAMKITE